MTDPLLVLRKLSILRDHVARVRRRRPDDVLAARGVFPVEFAQKLARMAGLRNRIAHAYAFADADRLHAEIPAGLDTLECFASAIASHLA